MDAVMRGRGAREIGVEELEMEVKEVKKEVDRKGQERKQEI